MNTLLLYLGAAFSVIWGIAHLIPTRNVVNGFGEITADNRRIITMEWIIEGATLIFIGVLTAFVAYADFSAWVSKLVYLHVAVFLVVLSIISLFTGFKVSFLPYKLCPFIFLGASLLIFLGGIYLPYDAGAEDSRSQFIEEVMAAEKAFADMAAAEGVEEAFIHFSADSAVMMRDNLIVKGKQEFRDYFAKSKLTDVQLGWAPDFVDVSASGDLAYTYGKYTFRATGPDGQQMEAEGIFHTVWKRQQDGSWKFVFD